MTFSIAGKTAIVTGSANGIGRAIARHFESAGANVMFADMDEERLKAEVGTPGPDSRIRCFAGDLRERLTLANLLSATLDAFDRVDILVNASRQILRTDALDLADDSVARLIEQNLLANVRLSKLVARRMIQQSEEAEDDTAPAGAIVNLSSIAARLTHPDLLAYSVSCAALEQMTRTLAVAYAPHRIRVNAVSFGSVMSASLGQALRTDEDLRERVVEATPLGRIAEAAAVAAAAQFLASDCAGFVTGEILTVDGGRSLLDVARTAAH